MSALDTIKRAILGVPFDPGKQPSRQGVVDAFAEIQADVDIATASANEANERIDDLELEADSVTKATWAELSAVTGTRNGQQGRVPTSDTGTHTDPVVGGTFPNSGIYSWSTSPAGWQWIDKYEAVLDQINSLASGLGESENGSINNPAPQVYYFDDGSGYALIRTDNVLFVWPISGQSNALGATSGPLVSTAPIYPGRALRSVYGIRMNGPRIMALVDAIETSVGSVYETLATSFLNHLIRDIDARFATGPKPKMAAFVAAQGSTAYVGLKRGSVVYSQLLNAIDDIVELARRDGLKVVVPGTIWVGGENDTFETTQQAYTAMMIQYQRDLAADILHITGQRDEPILFISQVNRVIGAKALIQPIQLAMIEAGKHSKIRLVGPIYDKPMADTVHKSSVGQTRMGQMFAHAIASEFFETGWTPLRVNDAYFISSTVIQFEMNVPVAPLVIDTAGDVSISGMLSYRGFNVANIDGTYRSITGLTVNDDTNLRLTLASAPTDPWVRWGYAMRRDNGDDDTTADGPITGARGCVRDSSSNVSIYDGHVLRTWMVQCSGRIPTF